MSLVKKVLLYISTLISVISYHLECLVYTLVFGMCRMICQHYLSSRMISFHVSLKKELNCQWYREKAFTKKFKENTRLKFVA